MNLVSMAIHLSFLLGLAASAPLEPAWNGALLPGSTRASTFTPLYVPKGSTAYAPSSPSIHRSGSWERAQKNINYGINGSSLQTQSRGAFLSLSFTGSGIEIYGGKGRRYGSADIYMGDKLVQRVNNFDDMERGQQLLFFAYGLLASPHVVKVVNRGSRTGSLLEIDALVITHNASPMDSPANSSPVSSENSGGVVYRSQIEGQWRMLQQGSTGVSAMQLSVISNSHAIIIDKVEHNPLTINGHPAWGALYNLDTHSVRPLNLQSNSFCAGGSFISNGTLVNVGGNPVVANYTSSADFGDLDGLQAIRLFHPCDSTTASDCEIYENHARIRMASPRWYNTVVRISDGSAMIIGGSKKGGWMNNATTNNPTIEYYPPKNTTGSNGLPIELAFLRDTLNSNLFPIAFSLPGERIFIAANRDAMIYDWRTNTEHRLPQIPNGVRVTYPMTGTGLLLPLSPDNGYEPVILLCGGSSIDDKKPSYLISSQDPASSQCSRMVLTDAGISAGWQVEHMPQARVMPDAVLLPDGRVLIINGGASGISGYGNVKHQVGESNADNPVLTPVLYDPAAPAGERFSTLGMPTSSIPRLYHSVATMTPNGNLMIAGSNPNLDRSGMRYGTEYRVEWLDPPYMAAVRPSIEDAPERIEFGQTVEIRISAKGLLGKTKSGAAPGRHSDLDKRDLASVLKVACMDLGFVTHAVHANSRLVYLRFAFARAANDPDTLVLSVTGPPNGGVYPPGPAWLYVVVDGVPSVGRKVMIGDGKGPQVDEDALENVLRNSGADQYNKEKKGDKDDSE